MVNEATVAPTTVDTVHPSPAALEPNGGHRPTDPANGLAEPGPRQAGHEASWALALAGRAFAPLPRGAVWDVWSRLRAWPCWSPGHAAAGWLGPGGWVAGARFEQTLDLGFPCGRVRVRATVAAAVPGRRAVWTSETGAVHGLHAWTFDDRPGGVLVGWSARFRGPPLALIAPLVADHWQTAGDAALRRLLAFATTQATKTGSSPIETEEELP